MLTQEALRHFDGTENYYRHFLGMVYTDGVKYVAETAGAYWLLDVIASHQPEARRVCPGLQIWTLEMLDGNKARVTLAYDFDDRGRPVKPDGVSLGYLIEQEIPFTDFPLKDGLKMYLADNVLMLRSEY